MIFFKENKERKLQQEARETSFDSLPKYLLIVELRFHAISCSHLSNNSVAGHIKMSRRPHLGRVPKSPNSNPVSKGWKRLINGIEYRITCKIIKCGLVFFAFQMQLNALCRPGVAGANATFRNVGEEWYVAIGKWSSPLETAAHSVRTWAKQNFVPSFPAMVSISVRSRKRGRSKIAGVIQSFTWCIHVLKSSLQSASGQADRH